MAARPIMAKTSTQLATRALTIINVTAAGQPTSAEDLATVKESLAPMLVQLATEEVVYVPDQEEIDDAIFLPLAFRLALQIGPDFGLPAMTPELEAISNTQIRKVLASRTVLQPMKAEYF